LVRSVIFSSDGQILFSGSNDRTIKLWDVKTVFIDFRLFQIPIFNLADMFIYLGQVISVISLVFLGVKFAIKQWRTN